MSLPLTLGFVVLAYMCAWFVVSLLKRRNDVADVAWGLGFGVLAWVSFWLQGQFELRGWLVNALVTVWGVRLAWHIQKRHAGREEDARYKRWRDEWGKSFYVRSFFQVFILQGALMYLIALPVIWINRGAGSSFDVFTIIGALVWVLGFLFESIGDKQLARFLADPANKGKIMQEGLWRYTRHPNYFGEVTQWWGVWIMALGIPFGWLTIIGPLTITGLILFVSGVPLTEKGFVGRPGFEEYKKRTSALVPWWVKEE